MAENVKVSKPKKKKIILLIVSGLIIIICALAFLNPMPSSWLGTRLYLGNRITVNMYITVDGKRANISKIDNNPYTLATKKDKTILKHRANDYETYEYELLINDDIPLNLTATHWNWWEITKSNLYIDIDTATETYTVRQDYDYTAETPNYHISHNKGTEKKHNSCIIIDENIGPVG